MNLLGHAYLSFDQDDILRGNMMGDFIKGKKILETLPEKIKDGVLLHRKIDQFTDNHPSVIMAANIFRLDYHLYSYSIIDIVFDHFLANDAKLFPNSDSLFKFSNEVYQKLKGIDDDLMPKDFKRLLYYLEEHQVLYRYRDIGGLKIALTNLIKRMNIAIDATVAINETFIHYYELNQYYFSFIKDIIPFAKKELNIN